MRNILTIFIFAIYTNVFACDCGYLGGFVYSNQVSDLVVYGRVISYESFETYTGSDYPLSMKFLIIEKLRGLEKLDTITIWGDNGAECRPYISHFEPNSEWILALNKYKNDYDISICGEFFLPVQNGIINGKVFNWTNNQTETNCTLNEIKRLVTNPFDYPLQRPQKKLKTSSKGIEYLTYCDKLPKNTIAFREINNIVNQRIKLPNDFLNFGDSYLIHARVIIDSSGKYCFNGTWNREFGQPIELDEIENQISTILEKTGRWKTGYESNKPVTAELIIPILLIK